MNARTLASYVDQRDCFGDALDYTRLNRLSRRDEYRRTRAISAAIELTTRQMQAQLGISY